MRQKVHSQPIPLAKEVQNTINLLIRQTDPINSLKMRITKQPQSGSNRDCRLPIPGTTIEKKYKDHSYTVIVLKDGFEYEQMRYKSLSAIAKKITGSHWNGYGFFGLEKR